MNMALAGGNAGAIGASTSSSSNINNFKPITPVQSTYQQRTQGSVFGDLTHGASSRQKPQGSASAGSLLSGNFGSLTDKTMAMSANGAVRQQVDMDTGRMNQDSARELEVKSNSLGFKSEDGSMVA